MAENARNNEESDINIFEKSVLILLDIINGDFRVNFDNINIRSGGDGNEGNDFARDMAQENGSSEMLQDTYHNDGPGPRNPNHNVKNVGEISLFERNYSTYFINDSDKTYYVKPEDAQKVGWNRVEVKPGQVYMGAIDGFASESKVVKVSDFVRVEIKGDGKSYYSYRNFAPLPYAIKGIKTPYQVLTVKDLETFNKVGDHEWDELFFESLKK